MADRTEKPHPANPSGPAVMAVTASPDTSDALVTLNLSVPSALKIRWAAHAEHTGRSMSGLVRVAVERFVDGEQTATGGAA